MNQRDKKRIAKAMHKRDGVLDAAREVKAAMDANLQPPIWSTSIVITAATQAMKKLKIKYPKPGTIWLPEVVSQIVEMGGQ